MISSFESITTTREVTTKTLMLNSSPGNCLTLHLSTMAVPVLDEILKSKFFSDGKGMVLLKEYEERGHLHGRTTSDTRNTLTSSLVKFRLCNRIVDFKMHFLSNSSSVNSKFSVKFLANLGSESATIINIFHQPMNVLKRNHARLKSLSEWEEISTEYLKSIIEQHRRYEYIYLDDNYIKEILALHLNIRILHLTKNISRGHIGKAIFENEYIV